MLFVPVRLHSTNTICMTFVIRIFQFILEFWYKYVEQINRARPNMGLQKTDDDKS